MSSKLVSLDVLLLPVQHCTSLHCDAS